MDDRQTRITEGAGLEESRLNQEFIDWLNKWGFRILMVVLILAAGWTGKGWWDDRQEKKLDAALVELGDEVATGSPDGLIALAKKHKGIESIWQQAMFAAASTYLESGRTALVPGGNPSNPDDFLTGEAADKQIELASTLYAQIIERAGRSSTSINALNARSGLVATMISLKNVEGAKAELIELIALLDESGYADLKRRSEERLASLEDLTSYPMPPSYAEISVIADQREPIAMYGETPEDVEAIRSRIKSEEMIEPKEDETPAESFIVPIESPLPPPAGGGPADGAEDAPADAPAEDPVEDNGQ